MSLFAAEPAAREILENAQLMLRKNGTLYAAFTNKDKKHLFEQNLVNIWINYHHQRYIKPLAKYPTREQIDSAITTIDSTISLFAQMHRTFPRVKIANRAKVECTISNLEDMLSIFRAAEHRERSVGRQANDPLVAQAVKKTIQALAAIAELDFPIMSKYASGRGENAFQNENVEFLYQLMQGIDENISRSMVATALRVVKKNSLQKGAAADRN